MREWWVLFLCWTAVVAADSSSLITPYLTSESDALGLINGVVNVANGQLVQVDHDIIIDGSDPFSFTRYYDGGHHFASDLGYGVGCSIPQLLKCYYGRSDGNTLLEQRIGALITFKIQASKGKWANSGSVYKEYYKSGYTNCCEALLRGEPDIAAITIYEHQPERRDQRHYCEVDLGNGTKRYYEKYWSYPNPSQSAFRLFKEKRGNGTIRYFSYTAPDSEHLSKIWTTNGAADLILNWLTFDYQGQKVTIRASNEEWTTYSLVNQKGKYGTWRHNGWMTVPILQQVESSHKPTVTYEHNTKTLYEKSLFQVKKVHYPEKRQLRVEYSDKELVKKLYYGDAVQPLYSFDYSKKRTDVTNALGGHTTYTFHDKRRLKEIKEKHRTQTFKWGSKGRLEQHTILDPEGTPLIEKHYSYNAVGNIVQVKVDGMITALGSKDSYRVDYTYSNDGRSNLLREAHNGELSYLYSYLPGSNLVASKRTLYKEQCQEREFFSYDNNAILIKKTVDDGSGQAANDMSDVTYRLEIEITPQLDPNQPGMTLPAKIEESYVDPLTQARTHLKTTEKSYTQGALLKEEHIYDAHDNPCYRKQYEYNSRRQLVSESNALREVTHYSYDDNDNLIRKEKAGTGKWTHYCYDTQNRLIEQIEEDNEGNCFSTQHSYDLMGNRIATTDRCKQVTRFEYDALGREIAVIDPNGYREQKEYDSNNHLTVKIDKAGHATTILNNIYGKPLKISHPDGSKEEFKYNLSGYLVKKVQRDGTYHCYQVDYAGRPIVIHTYSPSGELLKTEEKGYKGQQLTSKTDAMGNQTTYHYDPTCRLIKKVEPGRTTHYSYDHLGRLHQTTIGDSVEIKEYDNLDRIVEERTEDCDSTIYQKKRLAYDHSGNVIEEKVYIDGDTAALIKRQYNSDNLPTVIVDPEGHRTTIQYRYSDHFEKETVDAQGRRTLESYDPCHHLTLLKKLDASGTLLTYTTFEYEKRGLQVRRHDDRLLNGRSVGTYSVETRYDSMGEKISEIEQGQKKRQYHYENGKLKTLTLPDGTTLTHRYDPLGRLERLRSSDMSIDYSYRYDANDNLLISKDLVNDTTTSRCYNRLNQLIEEQQASGLSCRYSYDPEGRVTQFTMPDGSLTYRYSPGALTEVVRQGSKEYRYRQTTDWRGKVTSSTLPNGTELQYRWGLNGRCEEILSRSYNQSYSYDPSGNLTATKIRDSLGSFDAHYRYDGLNQLINEEGPYTHSYSYDALHNRCEKDNTIHTIDPLNQTTHDGVRSYSYDANGRRTQKMGESYSYDALGRLIQYEADGQRIRYYYDTFGRRIKKTIGETTYNYLYELDTEVAAYVGAILKEFKACHNKRSPFAVELDGECYSCIRTARGDICQLQDNNQKPIATYRYDAFGLFLHDGSIASPWLFSGQRYETETSLYCFLKRDYDPALGRWLTPDPLGFADGPNLYAYVHNNPLTHIDLYGLLDRQDQRVREKQNHFASQRQSKSLIRPTSFARGVADDSSWGASEYLWGKHEYEDALDKANYQAGVVASLVVGLLSGNTEAKAAAWTLKTSGKLLRAALIAATAYEAGKTIKNNSVFKTSDDVYAPDRDLPRDEDGKPVPDVEDAVHTQLGSKNGRKGKYPQAREFDKNGKHVKDIDFTDHGKPHEHPYNPHEHQYEENETGGTRKRGKKSEPLSGWDYY